MNGLRSFVLVVVSVSIVLAGGCRISVDKAKNGDDKNVKIDTPLGGVHVRSDNVSAADVGLPMYPGAELAPKKGDNPSADIHFGFGDWQFRLKVITYLTPDSQDKVLSFYKKALGRFGDVIQCEDKKAVGSPAVTREGLTCDDSENHHEMKVEGSSSLKAGSKRHQHIVAIENNSGPGTRFSLVQLDLPQGAQGEKQESN